MKKTSLLVALMLITSTSAFAAGPIGFGLQATGATLNFAEPLKSVYGFGYGGGAHLDINLPVLFSIRIAGDYTTYSPDNAKFAAVLAGFNPGTIASQYSIDGGRINIFSVSANGKLALPTPILSPYLTAGAGLASISSSDMNVKYQGQPVINASGAKAETNASVNFGAGVDLTLGLTLYLEAKYTIIFTEGESSSFVPVSLGITF